ncbi:sugar transporter SWEET1-like [Watersipora subatra]|uniref:sugar transporter SWEET1-like n=1 Tax=Watersipora subatra TaxID=2589382 RepID=UPI00355BE0CE
MEVLERSLQAVGLFNILAGIPGSLKMWKTGKTAGWPTLFFIIGLCGAVGMFAYGLLQNNPTLYVLNGLQVLTNTYYVLSFILLAGLQTDCMIYLTVAATYLAGLYGAYHSYDSSQLDERLNLIGSSTSAIFFLMNCSTILEVISAVKAKSARFDLTMLMFGMLSNALWITYGLLLNDLFIYGPALPFVVIGLMKIILMFTFSSHGKNKDD